VKLKDFIEEGIKTHKIEVLHTDTGKILRYQSKKKRSKLVNNPIIVKILRDKQFALRSNTLNYILHFLMNLKDANLQVTSIDRPLLIDLVKLNCECSKDTARTYSYFLECLWFLRDVL